MYTKDQLEEQLKNQAKSRIFEREFLLAVNRHLSDKKDNVDRTFAETKNWQEYRLMPAFDNLTAFTVEGDDQKFHIAKWKSFLRDATFYYDIPTIHEQRDMRFKLQSRYDDLFENQWRPPLQSRRDLVLWACQARNSYLQEREAPEGLLEDCENYSQLLTKYGPDYEALKPKLGHVRGLFD